jgi:acyl-CoA thioesterase-1
MNIIFSFARLLFLALVIISCNDKTNTGTAKIEKATKDSSAEAEPMKTILFFGNSLTAGYGIDPSEAFPALIQKKIDALKLDYKVVNAGVSGETTSGGNSRVDWILQQPVDVFILELGANDGLRGIPVTETRKNLQSIIDKVKAKYPEVKIVLAGMQIPPNMGRDYTSAFMKLYPELSTQNNAALIPFLLQGVGGEVKLNQQDGIHPTEEGHKILTENVWKVLKGIL